MLLLPIEVARLLDVAGRHPEGGAALLEGDLESVASLYQLHPSRVEQVRVCLAQPGMREQAEAIFASARLHAVPTPAPRRTAIDAPTLIARAEQTPDGLEFLTLAPIESAAVILGAHPFVVEQARQQLAEQPSSRSQG